MVGYWASAKTVVASSNATQCSVLFARALLASHSKVKGMALLSERQAKAPTEGSSSLMK
jgi:hypothetical protein